METAAGMLTQRRGNDLRAAELLALRRLVSNHRDDTVALINCFMRFEQDTYGRGNLQRVVAGVGQTGVMWTTIPTEPTRRGAPLGPSSNGFDPYSHFAGVHLNVGEALFLDEHRTNGVGFDPKTGVLLMLSPSEYGYEFVLAASSVAFEGGYGAFQDPEEFSPGALDAATDFLNGF